MIKGNIGFYDSALLLFSLTFSSFITQAAIMDPCPADSVPASQRGYNERIVPAIPRFDRVILVPGAGAQKTDLYVGPIHWQEYFASYFPFLEKAHIPYSLHAVSDTGDENVQTRYEKLLKEIKKAEKNHERILLIGHSMGGLVSRLVLRDKSTWKTIVGVIQISTPNLGTDLIAAIYRADSWIPWVSLLSKLVGFDMNQKEYMNELTYENAIKNFVTTSDFNPSMPPVFSIISADTLARLYEGIPLIGVGGQWITNEINRLSPEERQRTGVWETASDGVVPAYSQAWGHCLGWFHGSHAKSLGKVLLPGAKAEFAEFMTQLTGLLKPNKLIQYETSDFSADHSLHSSAYSSGL